MRIDIAALGWDHPEWYGPFFPEDLPEDWRLDYYANEFRAVAVPAAMWQEAGDEEVAAWLDAVPEGFAFFLEVPGPTAAARLAEVAAALGDCLGGLFGPGAQGPAALPEGAVVRWRDAPADPAALRSAVEALAARGGPGLLLFDGRPPDVGAMRTAVTVAELLGVG